VRRSPPAPAADRQLHRVGIIVGPSARHRRRRTDEIELLAELGIALLLFLVGLKLDVQT
jgi:Kef-type K+ transport system membrane component KefB